MSIEPFVYLTVLLFLTLLTFIARWLRAELEKISNKTQITKLPPFSQITPMAEESLPKSPTSQDEQKEASMPSHPLRSTQQTSHKVNFRTTADLRQGIILMEILGPCRAFTPPAEFRNLE